MGATPEEIDRAVARDAHEPPRYPAARSVVGLSPVPRAQEGVLQHLAGQLRVAYDAEGERVDEAAVTSVQPLEGGLVAPAHPPEELGIVRLIRRAPVPHAPRPHRYAY